MNSAFMCYYEHLAKLARVANKQTLFMAHMLYRMEWHSESKQLIVNLTAFDKRNIMKEITPDCKNMNRLANRYLSVLSEAGLIKSIGGGAYLVDPVSFGGHKYIPKDFRSKNAFIYETRVFSDNTEGIEEFYIVTEDGEKIELN
jgi:hypothetical protein